MWDKEVVEVPCTQGQHGPQDSSKIAGLLQDAIQANKKSGYPQSVVTLKGLRGGRSEVMVHRNTSGPMYEAASGYGQWLCIASNSDVDAMVTELYA